jgi:hypothetical protein
MEVFRKGKDKEGNGKGMKMIRPLSSEFDNWNGGDTLC